MKSGKLVVTKTAPARFAVEVVVGNSMIPAPESLSGRFQRITATLKLHVSAVSAMVNAH